MKAVFRVVYGVWCWTLLSVCGTGALLLALPLPTLTQRRRVARGSARLFLAASGMRLTITGLAHLPPGPCVLVANHASYLDGVIMQAALPPRFAFLIKREMRTMPIAGIMLARLGSEFMERHDRKRSGADARRVLKQAQRGHSLAVFPEGTFTATIGIDHFHAGAFMTAARAGLPVVPAVIRGARQLLPAEQFLPRPGRVHVAILPPLPAITATDRPSIHRLRDDARRAILANADEPDLHAPTDAG